MKQLSQFVAAFDAAQPKTKACIIAGCCGVFGVLCGSVLYIVFAHLFEQGGVRGKLIGSAVGLVVAIIIGWFADRLWETIDEGRLKLGGQARRTIVAVVSLVVVFELSASAFEDFARAYWSDRAALIRIAGDIAGRDLHATYKIGGSFNAFAFLQHMRAELKTPESACEGCVESPALRLFKMLPAATRIRVFAGEIWPTDDQIYDAQIDLPRLPLGLYPPGEEPCWHGVEVSPGIWFEQRAPSRAELTALCRKSFALMSDGERANHLARALNDLLARPDLYNADSFHLTTSKAPLELGPKLRARLERQRQACDAISATAVPRVQGDGCIAAIAASRAIPGSGALEPTGEIRAMNWELLAATFGPSFIEPLPIDWWDLGVLFAIWSAAAVVLGIYLTLVVFEGEGQGSGWRAVLRRVFFALSAVVLAALVAGVVLVLSRLLPFLVELMFDPTAPRLTFSFLAVVPWLVQLLAGGGLGVSIPGWISLPLIVGVAMGVWMRVKAYDIASRVAGFVLLGILATCVLPVLDGLLQVVLIVAGAWIVPTLGLTFLLPYLKPGADLPQWWGAVALAVGLAVAFWVGAMVTDTDPVYRGAIAVGGLLAAITGVLVLRRVPVGELWPLIAVTAGLTLVGGAAFQQLTFTEALTLLRPVSNTPVGERTYTTYDFLLRDWPIDRQKEDEVIPAAFRAPPNADLAHEAVRLELALTGSIGFWLTIGTLVAWSLKLGPRQPGPGGADVDTLRT